MASLSKPLAVRSTVQVAVEWLRQAIMNGEFKPGERLVEHRLAGQLGIGQPTLREAFKELELQGFLRKEPKRGTFVTKLSRREFRQILGVRMALETPVVERAATRLTPKQLAALAETVEGMRRNAQEFDLAEFHRHDVAFHETLWEAADNEFLRTALERTAFGLFAFVLLQREPDAADEFLSAVEQHEAILEGLRSGDPARAREAFVRSTLEFWNRNHRLEIELIEGATAAFA